VTNWQKCSRKSLAKMYKICKIIVCKTIFES
jgi:hypothetical protein